MTQALFLWGTVALAHSSPKQPLIFSLACKSSLANVCKPSSKRNGVLIMTLFQSEVEQAFYDALVRLLPQTEAAQRDYPGLVAAMADIAPTVDRFFDGPDSVLVMDPNPAIRENRLNLLGLLRNHSRVLADFGAILKP